MIVHRSKHSEIFIENDELLETFYRFQIDMDEHTDNDNRYTLDIFDTHKGSIVFWNIRDIKRLHSFLGEMIKKEM
jgi:uncharacterized Rmd1/YagE family protein